MNIKQVLLGVAGAGAAFAASAMNQTELQTLINEADDGATIEVTSDVAINDKLQFDKAVTLTSPEGQTNRIYRTTGCSVVSLNSDAVTLRLENLTLDGNAEGGISGRFSWVTAGTLVLGPGATIRDFNVAAEAAGIYLGNASRLVMEEGSEISGFTCRNYATAICIREKSAVFDMKGGRITNCHGSYGSSSQEYDGTIYVYGGTFNMSGGEISGNVSDNCVAGVCLYSGTVNMSGGLITGNRGGQVGGLVARNGTFNLSGDATLTNNVGGVVNDLFINGDTIYDPQNGKYPPANGYVSADYTGFATIYTTYEPKDSAVNSSPFEAWVKNFFVTPKGRYYGLARIRCQNYPDFFFDGYRYQDQWIYWTIPSFKVDGEYCQYSDEMRIALTNGETHVLEVLKSQAWDVSFNVPTNLTDLTIRCPEGTNHFWRETESQAVLYIPGAKTKVRLENITIEGNDSTSSDIYVMHGQLELGAGAIVQKGQKAVMLVSDDSKLVMEDGAIIRDCSNPEPAAFGFAVMVGQYSTDLKRHTRSVFEMKGGLITNCVGGTSASYPPSSGYGGAVYVYGGTLVMTGGKIAGNSCENSAAGVVNYAGTVRFSGDAVVENNFGVAPDLYIGSGISTSYFGDFRGRVGVSSGSQARGSTFGVKAESGATGAWCFHTAMEGFAHLIGAAQDDDPFIKWAEPAGSVDGVEIASVSDASALLPTFVKVDAEGRAALPHVFTGIASEASGTVTLDCSEEELKATGALPVTLFTSTDGIFSGRIRFVLPEDCQADLIGKRRGTICVLDERHGLIMLLK